MKTCPRCGETKPLSEFSKNPSRKEGIHSMCKACRRLYDHDRYARLRGRSIEYVPLRSERGRHRWLRSLKEGKACVDCGGLFPAEVLQWDHRPEFQKLGDISTGFWGRSRDEVLAEIAKCDLVCANCHAIRTFRRNGWADRWLSDVAIAYDIRYAV